MKIKELIKESSSLNIKKYLLNDISIVYFLCDIDDEIIYVGKTHSLNNRINFHKKKFPVKSIYYIECPDKIVKKTEKQFIKKTNPKHNIQLSGKERMHRKMAANISLSLYQACIGRKLRMKEIAKLVGIELTRFSKILNGKLQPTIAEKRNLSKILHVAQKDLF